MKKMFALLVSFILTAAAAMPALAAPPPDATVLFGGEGVGTFGVSGATYTENTLPSGWVSDSTYDGTTKTITYPEEEGNRYAKVSALSNTAATLNYKPAENIGLDSYFVWEAKLRIPEQAGGYVRDKSVTFYFTQWNANNFGITFKGNSSGEDAQKGKILITSDVIASSPYNTGISYEQGKWYTVQLAFHRADGQTQVILFLDGNYIHTFDLAGSNGTPYQTFNINRFSISCSPTYDTNPSSIEIDDVFAYTPSVSGSTEIAFSPAGNSGIVLNEETKTLAWEGDLTVSDLRSKLSFTAGSFRSVLADGKTLGDSEVIPNGATIVLAAADGYTFAEYTADVETSARAKDYFENKDGSFDSDLAYTADTTPQGWTSINAASGAAGYLTYENSIGGKPVDDRSAKLVTVTGSDTTLRKNLTEDGAAAQYDKYLVVEASLYITDDPGVQRERYLHFYGTGSSYAQFQIQFNGDGTIHVRNAYNIEDNKRDYRDYPTGKEYQLETWYRVTAVYEKGSNNVKIYLDGELLRDNELELYTDCANRVNAVVFGCGRNYNAAESCELYIDDVAIYNYDSDTAPEFTQHQITFTADPSLTDAAESLSWDGSLTVQELKAKITPENGTAIGDVTYRGNKVEDTAAVPNGARLTFISPDGITHKQYRLNPGIYLTGITYDSSAKTVTVTIDNATFVPLQEKRLFVAVAVDDVLQSAAAGWISKVEKNTSSNITLEFPDAPNGAFALKAMLWDDNLIPYAAAETASVEAGATE